MAVGYNNFDVPACTARGVLATNTPDVLTETTADFGFALMMAAARRMAEANTSCAAASGTAGPTTCSPAATCTARRWASSAWAASARRSRGAARWAFGMKVIYHNRSRLVPEQEAPIGARYVDKATLLREADHLVLVLPYSAASHHAIGAAELAQMKPTRR
jgi:gluconate 2-dehydrogenase